MFLVKTNFTKLLYYSIFLTKFKQQTLRVISTLLSIGQGVWVICNVEMNFVFIFVLNENHDEITWNFFTMSPGTVSLLVRLIVKVVMPCHFVLRNV